MSRTKAWRSGISLTVICAILTLSLFLWSPWHQHPAQGRKACAFLQVENSNGVEAQFCFLFEPPAAVVGHSQDDGSPQTGFEYWRRPALRAPPAL